MEFDDSSVKRHEACAITAHFLAAAAKAAVRMCGADGPVIGDVSKQFSSLSKNSLMTSADARDLGGGGGGGLRERNTYNAVTSD